MRSRSVLCAAAAVWSLGVLAAGSVAAAERSLLGITVGRSYRTVLQKYGTPTTMTPVLTATGTAPQLGAQTGGTGGFGSPGFGRPGFGGPGMGDPGDIGGFPGAGPGMMGGGPGMMGGGPGMPGMAGGGFAGGGPGDAMPGGRGGMPGMGGPPVLPGAGGFPGGGMGEPGEFPGGGLGGMPGGQPGFGGQQGQVSVGNAILWTYRRPGGNTMEFLVNEDGLVAQISVSGRSGMGRTGKGIGLGSDYKNVLMLYGTPEQHLITTVAGAGVQNAPMSSVVRAGGQVIQAFYPKRHHAAFTFLNNKVVRMTIALAE